jgi:hypothetical protein
MNSLHTYRFYYHLVHVGSSVSTAISYCKLRGDTPRIQVLRDTVHYVN